MKIQRRALAALVVAVLLAALVGSAIFASSKSRDKLTDAQRKDLIIAYQDALLRQTINNQAVAQAQQTQAQFQVAVKKYTDLQKKTLHEAGYKDDAAQIEVNVETQEVKIVPVVVAAPAPAANKQEKKP